MYKQHEINNTCDKESCDDVGGDDDNDDDDALWAGSLRNKGQRNYSVFINA